MTSGSRSGSKCSCDDPPAKILGQYKGQWIAIYHKQVVASGEECGQVLDEARAKLGGKEPTLMRVPSRPLFPL